MGVNFMMVISKKNKNHGKYLDKVGIHKWNGGRANFRINPIKNIRLKFLIIEEKKKLLIIVKIIKKDAEI